MTLKKSLELQRVWHRPDHAPKVWALSVTKDAPIADPYRAKITHVGRSPRDIQYNLELWNPGKPGSGKFGWEYITSGTNLRSLKQLGRLLAAVRLTDD